MKKIFLLLTAISLNVIAFGQCQSSFTSSTNGSTAQFTNTSVGSNLAYYWDFGDGGTSSALNPSHTYSTTGLYNVCLTIYSNDSLNFCQDVACDSIYILTDSTGACQANFTYVTSGSVVSFTNTSAGTNLGYYWTFGDGSSSSQMNPSYTYPSTGLYNVCLTIYSLDSLNNCQDTYCDSLYVMADSTWGTGCDASAVFDVNANGVITATATSSGASNYYWAVFDGNMNEVYNTTSNPMVYNTGNPNVYNTVCLTTYDSLQNLCDSTCYTVTSDSVTGLNKLLLFELIAYPNPANDFVNVATTDPSITSITLLNLSGAVVRQQNVHSDVTAIEMQDLPKGMYFIHALGREGQQLSSCKIVKR